MYFKSPTVKFLKYNKFKYEYTVWLKLYGNIKKYRKKAHKHIKKSFVKSALNIYNIWKNTKIKENKQIKLTWGLMNNFKILIHKLWSDANLFLNNLKNKIKCLLIYQFYQHHFNNTNNVKDFTMFYQFYQHHFNNTNNVKDFTMFYQFYQHHFNNTNNVKDFTMFFFLR